MEILHLEDFSNEVVVLNDFHTGLGTSSTGPTTNNTTDQNDPNSLASGGEYLSFFGSRTYYYYINPRYREFKLNVTSGDGSLKLTGNNVAHTSAASNASLGLAVDGAICFGSGPMAGTRQIIRFDYSYDGPLDANLDIGFMLTTQVYREALTVVKDVPVEFIIEEDKTLSIYIDNKLRAVTPIQVGRIYFGKRVNIAGNSVGTFTFTFKNLAIIRVPVTSKVKRLHRVRVASVDVSKVNDEVQTKSDLINDLDILNAPGLNLSDTNTIEFKPVEIEGNEKILGSETTMVVKAISADTVHTQLKDNDIELNNKTFPVSSTLTTRAVLGDNQLDDYSGLKVEITVENLEE